MKKLIIILMLIPLLGIGQSKTLRYEPRYKVGTDSLDINLNSNADTIVITGSEPIKVDGYFVIEDQVTIYGGTPGNGKILTSDATGKASWAAAAGATGYWTQIGSDIYYNTGQVWIGAGSGDSMLTLTSGSGHMDYLLLDNELDVTGNIIKFNGVNFIKSSNTSVFLGASTGTSNVGTSNVGIGGSAGEDLSTGVRNTFLGNSAGANITSGDSNVFIGWGAGFTQTTASNLLNIDNTTTTTPLIWGNFLTDAITLNNAADLALLKTAPTGGTDLAIATVGYVKSTGIGSGSATEVGFLNAGATALEYDADFTFASDILFVPTIDLSNSLIKFNGADAISSPSTNMFVGEFAGISNVSGTANTYVGERAGQNSLSSSNVFVGNQSGLANTTGDKNSFIGTSSGQNNTIGQYNVFNGFRAGFTNISGDNNVFLGYSSGYLNTTGGNRVAIGFEAGYTSTTASSSVLIGYQSGRANTGAGNVFIGNTSGLLNTTGETNTFIGDGAGGSNTSANFNTFIGGSAGNKSTGALNTIVGAEAGSQETISGDNNSIYGAQAGYFNTTGYSNTFIGTQSGLTNSTGYRNTFVGDSAGYSNTTGDHNVFLGYNTGGGNTEGSNNTFIGNQAGESNTTGTGNVFIGNKAGVNSTSSDSLYIANSSGTPLLGGNFATNALTINNAENLAQLAVQPTGAVDLAIATIKYVDDAMGAAWTVNGDTVQTDHHIRTDSNLYVTDTAFITEALGIGSTNPLSALHINKGTSSYVDGLTFDTGGYGFYKDAGNNIVVTLATTETYEFNTSYMGSTNSLRPVLRNRTPTSSNPTLLPSRGDDDTGVSVNGADQLSLTSGGVELVRLTQEDAADDTVTVNAIFSIRDSVIQFDGVDYIKNPGTANTFMGINAGGAWTDGTENTFIGKDAGDSNTSGDDNTFIGEDAGQAITTTGANVFIGSSAGTLNTGSGNTYIGASTGTASGAAGNNVFIAPSAGLSTTSGGQNIYIGTSAGQSNTTGSENINIGYTAGVTNSTGSKNINIGNRAGYYETGDSTFYMDVESYTNETNAEDSSLLYAEFNNDILRVNGSLGISTDPAGWKLSVSGDASDNQVLMTSEGGDTFFQIDGDPADSDLTIVLGDLDASGNSTKLSIFDGTKHITLTADSVTYSGFTKSGNPKFFASCSDSSAVVALTQNTPVHLTNATSALLTSARASNGFTFQNDSVQIPPLISGWYTLKATASTSATNGSDIHTFFYVDNVHIDNKGHSDRDMISTGIGDQTWFMDHDFEGGEWVKLGIENTGNSGDATIVDINWEIKFDE